MIPRGYAAVLSALRFDRDRADEWSALSPREWKATLALCDRTQLTLPLLFRRAADLPDFARARIEENLEANRERTRRLQEQVARILALLERHHLEPVLLKGFAHSPAFIDDPQWRVQFDLDLWLSREGALEAQRALRGLGYEPLEKMERFPTDHLPVLIRKTGWEWRGDYFDPEAPLSIDLHFRLWDRETEGFDAPGWQAFHERRLRQRAGSFEYTALDDPDALGYAAMHALRHLLRGNLRPFHAYEIASFLEKHAGDGALWERWRAGHDEGLRRLEAVVFALAGRWFGCRMHEAASEEVTALPGAVREWMHRYSAAPLEAMFSPNKHELWLHFALLDSHRAAMRVLARRLLPVRWPAPVDSSVLLPDPRKTWWIRLRAMSRYAIHVVSRSWLHIRTVPWVIVHGAGWAARRSGIQEGFARYLIASALFSAGVFVFLLLYNLHLLGLGYREDFLGQVTAAQTIGGIAGTLPAGWVAHRYGLRITLLATIALVAALSALRSIVTAPGALVAAAFAGGAALSGWAVQFMPAVAQLTTPEGRARGFSLFAATGIATGAVAGFFGGRLPEWIGAATGVASEAEARRIAILLGCALILMAAAPARRLRFPAAPPAGSRSYPSGGFVVRFLGALSVWHLATGSFNSFFNAWLVRHAGASTETVGTVFSASQLTQVLALLAAPAVLRRLGVIRGVASMQAVTGLCLMACAGAAGVPAAAVGYVAYMAAQYMSEPGMFTLLMDRVKEGERGGASALHFLTVYATHAIAALAAGAAYARFGYPPVLLLAALAAIASALLFKRLLR